MECDFSGWATKASVKCTDGRTIMPNAFQHQDTMKVPLVWQHGHKDPENVLGHVLLENRDEGVYAYAFFNDTPKAKHAKQAVEHKDINAMSIWANGLVEKSKRVVHGAIREVSLVLSGANPEALIENVTIRHSDGDLEELEDEYIIQTGLPLEHSKHDFKDDEKGVEFDLESAVGREVQRQLQEVLQHKDGDKTVSDVYDSMTDEQKDAVHYLIGVAVEEATMEQSDLGDDDDDDDKTEKEGKDEMKHNVFESDADQGSKGPEVVLSHDDMKSIVEEAKKHGSLKQAVENYAEAHLSHGIEDIDTLFPEAKTISNTPELFGRRVEWVNSFLGGTKKSPFSRIKTLSADITVAEARAKGYIKGSLKKEEFFKVSKRVTTPTTVYKKQKLDRDDMVDITDFDVVAWLKGEMRVMLDEEIARAALVGDGRESNDEDKIDEERIRPIATDHELYTTTITVDIDDASSNMSEVVDHITLHRSDLRGTGLPTLYTTETFIAKFMTQRDTLGRRIYKSLEELATELRVQAVVPVEVLEEYSDIIAILVNPVDYTFGATAGGEVSLFDDFDIDYNQYKYLIETRCCGALTKLKAAMVVKKTAGDATLVVPAAPAFDGSEVTITDQTGVVYRNADTDAVINNAGSPYAVAEGETMNVHAEPSSASYYFESSNDDDWSFTNTGE